MLVQVGALTCIIACMLSLLSSASPSRVIGKQAKADQLPHSIDVRASHMHKTDTAFLHILYTGIQPQLQAGPGAGTRNHTEIDSVHWHTGSGVGRVFEDRRSCKAQSGGGPVIQLSVACNLLL